MVNQGVQEKSRNSRKVSWIVIKVSRDFKTILEKLLEVISGDCRRASMGFNKVFTWGFQGLSGDLRIHNQSHKKPQHNTESIFLLD